MDPVELFPAAMDRFSKVSPLRDDRYRWFLCPAHDDHHPSGYAWVHPNSNMLVLRCFRGCTQRQIMVSVGLQRKDIHLSSTRPLQWVTEGFYDYQHADGSIAFRVVRLHGMEGETRVVKKFIQRKPLGEDKWADGVDGVERPLYRLPELRQAVRSQKTIYFVEGEKKCDLVRSIGLAATTMAGGSNARINSAQIEELAGQRIILCEDNDDYGKTWGAHLLYSLMMSGRIFDSVSIMRFEELPEGGDIADLIESRQNDGLADEDIRQEILARSFGLAKVMVK